MPHRPSRAWASVGALTGALAASLAALPALAAPAHKPAMAAPAHRRAGPGPGCDPSRPAVAHYAGGVRLHRQPAHRPIPCMTLVGQAVESATIGITRSGTVFYATRDDNNATPPQNTLQGPEFVVRSRNDGATWTALGSGGPTTGGLVPPWMSVDPVTSRIWFLTTLPGLEGARLSWSDDDGRQWQTNPAVGCRGPGATGCLGEGSEKILEGPAPPGGPKPHGYRHVVYYCGNGGVDVVPTTLACYRSLDGGRTFAPIGTVPDPPTPKPGACGVSHVARPGVVGPDGDLYFSLDLCGDLGIAISRDEGATWQRRPIAHTNIQDLYTTSVATDSAGDVYLAWVAGSGTSASVEGRGLPYLIVSRDHGRTWSSPMMIAAPGVRQVMHTAITATGTGRIAVSYLGSQSTATDAGFSGYITESSDALASRPVFLSAAVNRPASPLYPGSHNEVFGDRLFFIGDAFAPGGTAWAAFQCVDEPSCPGKRIGVAARLVARDS